MTDTLWRIVDAWIGIGIGGPLAILALFVGVIGLAILPATDYAKESRWRRLYGKTCGPLRAWFWWWPGL